MKIQIANIHQDFSYLRENDLHLPAERLRHKIEQGKVIIIKAQDKPVGWLRYGLFWDLIPMMNMLMIETDYRGQGLGRKLVEFWESEMAKQGYKQLMTSTLSDEQAQHFYRKLGYKDAGALFLPDEALEIILMKTLP
jgi:ribosomal protein S18 acetylase RimI-like enzyme